MKELVIEGHRHLLPTDLELYEEMVDKLGPRMVPPDKWNDKSRALARRFRLAVTFTFACLLPSEVARPLGTSDWPFS
jgi:hypothetical protein